MQPTYLPWLGYFDMIAKVDKFLFLDKVQFQKKSWQSRNYIKFKEEKFLLSIPISTAGQYQQMIMETEIVPSQKFPKNHLSTIKQAYLDSNCFNAVYQILEEELSEDSRNLADLNISIITRICSELNIRTELLRASDLSASGANTKLTVQQCIELGATTFFCAAGAQPYVEKELGFLENGIQVEYQDYQHPIYAQPGGEFIPKLSVIDFLFNKGFDLNGIVDK